MRHKRYSHEKRNLWQLWFEKNMEEANMNPVNLLRGHFSISRNRAETWSFANTYLKICELEFRISEEIEKNLITYVFSKFINELTFQKLWKFRKYWRGSSMQTKLWKFQELEIFWKIKPPMKVLSVTMIFNIHYIAWV